MRVDFLGAARVIDNFIGGVMEPYSYEDYLRDFVNCSSYFLKKSNGKLYKKPESEAHGEHDCASDDTSLILSFLHLNQGCKRLKSSHHQSKNSCPV